MKISLQLNDENKDAFLKYVNENKLDYKEHKTAKQRAEEKRLKDEKRTPEEKERINARIQKMKEGRLKKKMEKEKAKPTKEASPVLIPKPSIEKPETSKPRKIPKKRTKKKLDD